MRAYTLVPYTTLFRSGDARSVETSDAAAIQGECCCGEEVSERIGRSDLAGRREAGAREEIVLISSRDRSSAPLKTHHHCFERLRPEGLAGSRVQFHAAATVQDLKALVARLIFPPTSPFA